MFLDQNVIGLLLPVGLKKYPTSIWWYTSTAYGGECRTNRKILSCGQCASYSTMYTSTIKIWNLSFYRHYSHEGNGKRDINQKQLKRPLPSLPIYQGECFITIIFASFCKYWNIHSKDHALLDPTREHGYWLLHTQPEYCRVLCQLWYLPASKTILIDLTLVTW